MYNRFHKELRFFFSLLKRKKKQKKKRVRIPLVLYGNASPEDYARNCHNRFSSTKLPRRGEQAAAAAVTLPFLQLKLGRNVNSTSPLLNPRNRHPKIPHKKRHQSNSSKSRSIALFRTAILLQVMPQLFPMMQQPERGESEKENVDSPIEIVLCGRGEIPHQPAQQFTKHQIIDQMQHNRPAERTLPPCIPVPVR